jgi:predicted PhzF superfamily epimerase YddE/YHI9
MFAPRYGIKEESATGMAAGPLACVLYDIVGIKKHTFQIEQGKFMAPPSPSLISVDLTTSNGKITGLMAGGKGKVQQDIEIEL